MTAIDDRVDDLARTPTTASTDGNRREHHRVVIVGTGFAGIGMAVRLLQAGIDDFVVLERAAGPGGTWRDNTYPGCQCDVPSVLYSFSFAPNPGWTRTFSRQAEIRAYLERVTHEFDVARHVRWNAPLLDVTWDEATMRWTVTTPHEQLTADVVVLGAGPLAEPSTPDIPGFERFRGTVFHSARWNHDHDLRGERVAVIGTGASSIQIVPSIQPTVGHLDVYQRTPAWVLPHPDRPTTRLERMLYRRVPLTQKAMRALVYLEREALGLAMARRGRLLRSLEHLARSHLARQVPDPDLRRRLTPRYELGCKRLLISNTYFPALAQPNVDVVTDGIRELTEHGIVTVDGTERPVDTIVLATGFHVTDSPTFGLVHGRGGRSLLDAFEEHGAYLGTTSHGFPNLYVMAGPNTGIGHTSLVYMLESQAAYVMDALATMEHHRFAALEVRAEVQATFFAEMQSASTGTVWASGCNSWYLDRFGRNAAVWPGLTFRFRRRTRGVRLADYHAVPARVPAGTTIGR